MHIDVLSQEEGTRFLIERVHGTAHNLAANEEAAAAELAEVLGYLPLALEQAAAYIAQKGSTYHNYLTLFRAKSVDLLERAVPETGEYGKTIATTWQINFDEVARDSEAGKAAIDLMRFCAFLAPDNIPIEIVFSASQEIVESLIAFFQNLREKSEIEDAFSRLLEPLMRYSLVIPGSNPSSFNVHRLVQDVIKWQMPEVERDIWIGQAILILNQVFPGAEYENWPTCERLIPHVQKLVATILHDADFALGIRMLNEAADYLHQRARYGEAEPLFTKVLEINRRYLPSGHPHIANSIQNLSTVYLSNGMYSKAKTFLVEALNLQRAPSSQDQSNAVLTLAELAELYRITGRFEEAEKLFEEVLAEWPKFQPENSTAYAMVNNNAALLYSSLSSYDKAEKLFKKALEITNHMPNRNEAIIGKIMTNIASLYNVQERYIDAEHLLIKAINIFRKIFPEGHPSISHNLNNLAFTYISQKYYNKAETLLYEALQIQRKTWPHGHINTAISLDNLAWIYEIRNNFDKAYEIISESFYISNKLVGNNHPTTKQIINRFSKIQIERILRRNGISMIIVEDTMNRENLSLDDALARLLGESWQTIINQSLFTID